MPLQAQRTLVKSQPELWAEVSDAASLARHLGELGEIRITRVEAERAVEWEAQSASGTLELEPSGWGTRVTITAERAGVEEEVAPAPPAPPEPPPTLAEAVAALMASAPPAEAEAEEQITEENPVVAVEAEDEPRRYRARWWSRWMGWRAPRVEAAEPEAAAEPGADAEPEAEPVAVIQPAQAVAPEPVAVAEPAPPEPEPEDPELLGVLTGVLDSLGTAHHRPFSRP
jgi:hypothetical protein